MKGRKFVDRFVLYVALLMWVLVIPALAIQSVDAHKLKPNGRWLYSVSQTGDSNKWYLHYKDMSNYGELVSEARYQWRQAGPVVVAAVGSAAGADIVVVNVNNCSFPWLGQYYYDAATIAFNVCAFEWQGGVYPGDQTYYGATPASRRTRTVVHEFGHAQGLDHNDRSDCSSVMSKVRQDQATCWVPKAHDIDDVNRYWD